MQIVSSGDNLHEMSKPIFGKNRKKNIINFSSAKIAQRVFKVRLTSRPTTTSRNLKKKKKRKEKKERKKVICAKEAPEPTSLVVIFDRF